MSAVGAAVVLLLNIFVLSLTTSGLEVNECADTISGTASLTNEFDIKSYGDCAWLISVTVGRAVIEFTYTFLRGSNAVHIHANSSGGEQLPDTSVIHYGTVVRSPGPMLFIHMDSFADSNQDRVFNAVVRSSAALVPQSVSLRAISSGCMELTWKEPLLNFTTWRTQDYEVQCNNATPEIVPRLDTSFRQCGFSANQPVQCRIRVRGNLGGVRYGEFANSSMARTFCNRNVPAVPDIQPLPEPVETIDDGRIRLMYNLTWRVASDCLHSESPYRIQINNKVINSTSTGSYVLYADGDENITFTVQSRNFTGSLSSPSSVNWRTPILNPQIAPENFTVSANSSCITCMWQDPEYDNGPRLGYQYSIDGGDWINLTADAYNQTVCGFDPNQRVECSLRSFNSAGFSNVSTVELHTDCFEPMMPSDFLQYVCEEIYQPPNSSTDERRIVINETFLEQSTTANCDAIDEISYKVKFPGQEFTNSTNVINSLYGYTNYTIEIRIVNNRQLETRKILTVTTGELVPHEGPELSLTFGTNYVALQLEVPPTPNGKIIHFKYRCGEYISEDLPLDNSVTLHQLESGTIIRIQGFQMGDHVKCQAVAINSKGTSPITTKTGYTLIPVQASESLKADAPAGALVKLTIPRVVLDVSQDFMIRSYFIIVEIDRADSLSKADPLSSSSSCFTENLILEANETSGFNCYIAAEINSSAIADDGLVLTVGDNSRYGFYHNRPLETLTNYTFKLSVSIIKPGNSRVYQSISSATTFVPALRCPPPPSIGNADSGPYDADSPNATVNYTCQDGYSLVNNKSSSTLQCQLNGGISLQWIGDLPICREAEQSFPSAALAGGLTTLVIVLIIILVIWLYRRRVIHRQLKPTDVKKDSFIAELALRLRQQPFKGDNEEEIYTNIDDVVASSNTPAVRKSESQNKPHLPQKNDQIVDRIALSIVDPEVPKFRCLSPDVKSASHLTNIVKEISLTENISEPKRRQVQSSNNEVTTRKPLSSHSKTSEGRLQDSNKETEHTLTRKDVIIEFPREEADLTPQAGVTDEQEIHDVNDKVESDNCDLISNQTSDEEYKCMSDGYDEEGKVYCPPAFNKTMYANKLKSADTSRCGVEEMYDEAEVERNDYSYATTEN